MKQFNLILICLVLTFAGCLPFSKSKVDINFKKNSKEIKPISVSSVQIINHQLVVTGNNLNSATDLKVNGQSFNEDFVIESKSDSQIIANSLRAFSFDVSKVFNLIISNAEASATFPIDFSICNATLNGKGFNCSLGASDKDVLSYDATTQTWKPRPATSGLNYLGAFDASSNPSNGPTPYPAAGAYYIIGHDGMVGATTYVVGDWMVSNGSAWQKIDNSTLVGSVFNRTGNVVAQKGDYELNQLFDVDLTTPPTNGQVLKFNGTDWVAGNDDSAGGANSVNTTAIVNGAVTDAKITSVSASKITGTISSSQILDGTIVNADISATAAIDYSKLNIPNTTIPYAKLNIANGDIPVAKISGIPAVTTVLSTTITDGDTTHAPDGNSVHDALALKFNTTGGSLTGGGTISNVPDPVNADDVANRNYVDTKVAKAGGTMTGDLSVETQVRLKGTTNYVALRAASATTAYTLTLPATAGTSGYVLSTDGSGVLSWISSGGPATGSLTTDQQAAVTINPYGTTAGNTGEVRLKELAANGSNYIAFKSPDALGANQVFIMPSTAGTNGDVLTSNGSNPATLSWTTPTSGTSATLTGDIGGTVGANTIGSGKVTLTHLSATGTKDNTTYLRGDNTWAPLGSGVLATPLTSLSLATGTAITASDTVLSGMGKLQKQISDIPAQPAAPTGTADATTYHAGDNTWKSFGSNVRGTVLTGLDATGINYASRTIASTDSALVAFNKMLFTQGDYVSKSSDQTIYGSLKINSTTGFIEVPDPIGVMDATNKQYVDAQIKNSVAGSLLPANSTILMNACPSGWTTAGQVTSGTGQVTCGTNMCFQCQSPSTDTIIPASSIFSTEVCPTGWYKYQTTIAVQPAASVDSVFYSACRSPAQDARFPEGMRVLMDACPAGWKTVGRTPSSGNPQATCPSGACYSCEVPSLNSVNDTLIAAPAAYATEVGKSLNMVAGAGGVSSGVGGSVHIRAGLSNSTAAGGSVNLYGGSAVSGMSGGINLFGGDNISNAGSAAGGHINLTAGSGGTSGSGGNVTINSGVEAGSGTKGHIFLNTNANTGNVGVGTITPASKLDVNGSVRVGADATACSSTNAGAMRFTSPNVEYCNGTAWTSFSSGGSSLNSTLTALSAFNTNGIIVQTAADTYTGRSIAGTTDRVTVTNGNGVSGNPTIDVSTSLLPSPAGGDSGKFLAATGANAAAWRSLNQTEVNAAIGYTPLSKAGESLVSGIFDFSGSAVLRTLDPIGLTDVTNKQYVDNQITISKSGSLFPANNTLLMNSCPSGWTNLGQIPPGSEDTAFCGPARCYQCQAPATDSLIPTNSIILAENCPVDWVRISTATNLGSAGINGVLYSACQAQMTSRIPEGTRVLMDSCPVTWKTIGRTNINEETAAACPSGTCYSCEVPSSKVTMSSLIANQSALATEVGKSIAILAGNGGSTSGDGGDVNIDSGIASGSGAAGNIHLNLFSGGNVGIGKFNPSVKLDVDGAIKMANTSVACSSTTAGTIRYNSTSVNFEECDGVSWKSKRVSGNLIPANSVVIMGANGTAGLCPTGWTSVGQVTGSDGAVGCGSGGTYCSQCQSPASDSLLPASTSIVSENCPEGWVRSAIGGSSANSTIYNGTHVTACRAPSSNSSIPGGMRILMDECPAEWKFVATTDKTGLGSVTCPSGACKLCEAPGSSSPSNLLIGGSFATANAYAGIIGGPGAIPSGAGGKALVFGGDATSGTGGEVNIKGGSTDSGAGGLVSISGGNSQAGGNGGNITITSGVSPVAGNSGSLFIRTGAGGTTSGSAGSLQIAVGATTSGTGGSIAMTAGHSSNGNAGAFNIFGGNGGTNGNGGDINITSGTLAGTGVNGKILLNATNAGLVGIGTSSPNTKLDVTGVVNASGGYTQVSDIRLKTNIQFLNSHDSLERLLTLRGIFYDWKDQKQYGKSRQLGLIAQDVKKVFPNAIRENLNGILTVSYSSLIAPIIESLKEIRNWLVGHDKEIALIKAQNAKLIEENLAIKSYLCSRDPEAMICK